MASAHGSRGGYSPLVVRMIFSSVGRALATYSLITQTPEMSRPSMVAWKLAPARAGLAFTAATAGGPIARAARSAARDRASMAAPPLMDGGRAGLGHGVARPARGADGAHDLAVDHDRH